MTAPVLTMWLGRLSGSREAIRAPEPFVLAGIDWQGPGEVTIELRARLTAGGWTPWVRASVLGHDSDRGESIPHALVGEPVWTGPADTLELRSSGAAEGVNLHLVPAAAVGVLRGGGRPAAGLGSAKTPEARAAADGQAPTTADGLPLATPHLPAGPGQPPIIARRAWAHDLLPRAAPAYGDIRMVFVHHSVNANGYTSAEVPAILRSIYTFHTYSRGWNDFGYNFAVDAYGHIWEGRAGGIDRPVIGAQAGGYNAESFGVVLLGDFAATLPTGAAMDALAHLIAWKLALHGVPVRGQVMVEVDPPDAHYTRFRPGQHVSLPRIAGHRDGCTTDCPGSDLYVNGMAPLRRSVAALTGRQHSLTLTAGRPPGAYALAPYPIAPGTRVKPATYLDLQTVTITAARQLPLHGFLRSLSGDPLRDARIALQDLSSTRHQDPEEHVATAITDHRGLWVTELRPSSNMLLRALHADAPAAVSALMVVAVKPEVTLIVEPHGEGVLVSGTVTPHKRHVLLEASSAGGRRHPAQRVSIEAHDGLFRATIRLRPGRYWIRARTPADASNLEGESPTVAASI